MVKGKSNLGVPLTVPCGRCIGCRVARTKEWATRIAHEASLHAESSFVTLTYDDDHLPDDYSVHVREMQLFLKRLRKALEPTRIRFFACGEYGDQTQRPHYHLILFGVGFDDKKIWRRTAQGHHTYRSLVLEKAWPYGFCEIGTVTPQSGAYVARYCIKKINGETDHYQRLHPVTGEIVWVEPEFAVMSTRPGIGSAWFDQYEMDAFPSDFLIVDGKKTPIPSYYSKKLRDRYRNDPSAANTIMGRDDLDPIIKKRREYAKKNAENSTSERLAVRELSAQLRNTALKRELD